MDFFANFNITENFEVNFINELKMPLNKSFTEYPISMKWDLYITEILHRYKHQCIYFDDYINMSIIKYKNCIDIINNKNIPRELVDKYKIIKNKLVTEFRLNIKFFIDNHDKIIEDRMNNLVHMNHMFSLVSLILTNGKYCVINNLEYNKHFFMNYKYFSIIEPDTKIYLINFNAYTSDSTCFDVMFKNPELFETEFFINSIGSVEDKYKWINNLDVHFGSDYTYTYNGEEYYSLKYIENIDNINSIKIALMRFGIFTNDLHNYLLLFSKNIITSVQTPYGKPPKFKINNNSSSQTKYFFCKSIIFNFTFFTSKIFTS